MAGVVRRSEALDVGRKGVAGAGTTSLAEGPAPGVLPVRGGVEEGASTAPPAATAAAAVVVVELVALVRGTVLLASALCLALTGLSLLRLGRTLGWLLVVVLLVLLLVVALVVAAATPSLRVAAPLALPVWRSVSIAATPPSAAAALGSLRFGIGALGGLGGQCLERLVELGRQEGTAVAWAQDCRVWVLRRTLRPVPSEDLLRELVDDDSGVAERRELGELGAQVTRTGTLRECGRVALVLELLERREVVVLLRGESSDRVLWLDARVNERLEAFDDLVLVVAKLADGQKDGEVVPSRLGGSDRLVRDVGH